MNGIDATKPREIEKPAMLIGEGVEEVRFFGAYLKHLRITSVQVEEYKGKSGLSLHLRTLKKRPGFASLEVLGITRDADADPAAALASVQQALRDAAFPAELKVACFVLPAPGEAGALEHLCLATLRGAPLEQCLDEFFACAGRTSPRTFETDALRAKARIHAWLAAQNPPHLRLGEAAEKDLIDFACPAFDELKKFLLDLYG